MNWTTIEGQWHQLKGQAKSQWGKLTDSDLTLIAGKKEQLAGKLQESYGLLKEDAEKQIDDWLARMRPGQINDAFAAPVDGDSSKVATDERVSASGEPRD